MPLDPVELADDEPRKDVPNFIDENPTLDLILEGMDVSENELRDTADETFGEDPSLPISGEPDDQADVAPEIAAIHLDRIPDDR